MKVRGEPRGPGTWLAIQASTKASTWGDLRIRAHSDGVSRQPPSRTTMGERVMAAIRARKPPVPESTHCGDGAARAKLRLSPKNQGDSKELPSGRGRSAHLGGSYGRGQEIG